MEATISRTTAETAYEVASDVACAAASAAAVAARTTATAAYNVEWAKMGATVRSAAAIYGPETLAAMARAIDFSKESSPPFEVLHTPAARKALSKKLMEDYPGTVPVIVSRYEGSRMPRLAKKKFLVRGESTIAVFSCALRRSISVEPSQGIMMFVKGSSRLLSPPFETMGSFYTHCRSEDGFLYLTVREENVFG